MSSPLSVLKKTRRAPLQGPATDQRDRPNPPFRRDLLREFQAEVADERSAPAPSHAATSTSKSNVPLKKAGPPTDFELMSAMMQRISLLEETVRRQAHEIKGRDKIISVLEKKLKEPNESESDGDPGGSRDLLEKKCRQLQDKAAQLESVLWDCGLVCMDSSERGDSAEGHKIHNIKRFLTQPDKRFHMNFDLVLQNIKELNSLTGERDCFIQPTATGAKLVKQQSVRLTLYSNGIAMFDGPFRSYQEPSTQRCMQDLMDGYLPSELQDRFPDGVPFEVHDRRHEEFVPRKPNKRFPGVGQAVHGDVAASGGQHAVGVPPPGPPLTLTLTPPTSSLGPGKKVGVEHFLSRLPKAIVKAGHVIDIRTPMRETLQGLMSSSSSSSSTVTLIDTAALQTTKDSCEVPPPPPPPAGDVITLKVKSEDGDQTFVLKMFSSDTIGLLRRHLNKHRGGGLPDYDIISVWPRRRCEDEQQTLRSCGLTSNTTLRLWRRRRQH
ncbi:UBX domain-containing protein 11 [Nelusetta ayraudi]|uniref:UBX domain-containing protein 11 n=1 Tax=Nelusetta ayraudi TaxID=303726 RepID=UPI003F70B9C8